MTSQPPSKANGNTVILRLADIRIAGKDPSKRRKLSRRVEGRSIDSIGRSYSREAWKRRDLARRWSRQERRNNHRGIDNRSRVCLNLNEQLLAHGMQVTDLDTR